MIVGCRYVRGLTAILSAFLVLLVLEPHPVLMLVAWRTLPLTLLTEEEEYSWASRRYERRSENYEAVRTYEACAKALVHGHRWPPPMSLILIRRQSS